MDKTVFLKFICSVNKTNLYKIRLVVFEKFLKNYKNGIFYTITQKFYWHYECERCVFSCTLADKASQ